MENDGFLCIGTLGGVLWTLWACMDSFMEVSFCSPTGRFTRKHIVLFSFRVIHFLIGSSDEQLSFWDGWINGLIANRWINGCKCWKNMFELKLPCGTSCFEVSLRKGWLSVEHGNSWFEKKKKCCFEVWKNEGTTNPTPGIASTWDVWRFHFLQLLWLYAFHPIFWTTSQHPRVRIPGQSCFNVSETGGGSRFQPHT